MKKLVSLLFWIISILSYSQEYGSYDIDFEDPSQFFRIKIDTISNPNNIWQIGKPLKTNFNSGYSPVNVIITDTMNFYPIKDTSVFTISHVASEISGFPSNQYVALSVMYQVNSDSICDFGMIEFSPDNDITWVNLITDTLYLKQECYEWWNGKPTLTGKSNGWNLLNVWVAGFGRVFNILPGDTVLFRFSFISDSLQTNKDGLMFDNFQFADIGEGIKNFNNQFESIVFPNPVSHFVSIKFENLKNDNHILIIYNSQGQNILNKKLEKQDIIQINMGDFKPDIYYYRVINQSNGKQSTGKIIRK